MVCWDQENYRSPINDFTCNDHRGTDCISWRFVLGGNITALEDLINSCPVSCNIECGAFQQQNITLSFIVSGLPHLIDIQTQTSLEDVVLDFLADYVESNKAGEAVFVLEKVRLKSQEPLEHMQEVQKAGTDQENLLTIQLRVALFLSGFSINLHTNELTALLISGVDSDEFTGKLKTSAAFFSKAKASYAIREVRTSTDLQNLVERDAHLDSDVAITFSALVGVFIVSFLFGAIFFHFYSRKREQSVFADSEESPKSPQSISVFSFLMESSTPRGDGFFFHQENILGSLSRSKDSDDSISTAKYCSMQACNSGERKVHEHPLTGLIPPMIVIENVDETDIPKQKDEKCEKGSENVSGFPAEHITASSSFVRALNTSHEAPTLIDFLSPLGSACLNQETSKNRTISDFVSCPKSDYICDDSFSVTSIPVRNSEIALAAGPLLRRSSSGNDLDNTTLHPEFFFSSSTSSTSSSFHNGGKIGALPNGPLDNDATHTPILGRTIVTPSSVISMELVEMCQPRSQPAALLSRAKMDSPLPSLSRSKTGSNTENHRRSCASMAKCNEEHCCVVARGNITSNNSEIKYAFEVPTAAKLGLVIESVRRGKGARIRTVREGSPLYGAVFSGDRIISIDLVETSEMHSKDISKILSRRWGAEGRVHLVVARSLEKNKIPTIPNSSKYIQPKNSINLREGKEALGEL